MNVKKMFATLAGVLMVAQAAAPMVTGAATYSDELQGAYEYAYSKGITTMTSIDNANMYGELTRGQLAKMISNWAESELGRTADETAVCSFTDTNTAEGDLATYVVKACQMGLMGQGITAFRPNDKVTRGEFGTTLSRAIWGDKYDGANPYYANHLAALSQEGIMTKISEPNNLEIRGWVMLMLQRAATTVAPEECKDAAVVMACALDPESDACPVACRKTTKDDEGNTPIDEKVKSGDLQVTASASTNKKAIIGATSDLDTIVLKASEAITLNSVTIERYGYSSASGVTVWLEDDLGNKITNEKVMSTKDEVTLNIKKDYRELSAESEITIVVHLDDAMDAGTIGFKVNWVESSAKNVNLQNYDPYTYEMIKYTGTSIKIEGKWKDTTYNYTAGNFYEVARLKLTAGNADVLVNWLFFENSGSLDLADFVDDVKVLVWGKEVSGVKYTVKKDDFNVNFDDVEIESKKNATFSIEVSFKDLDKFNENVQLSLKETTDINALEKKTGTRVSIYVASGTSYTPVAGAVYTFKGGKITLSNVKLWTIDAAAGSDDIVIWEGKITLWGGTVELEDISIVASWVNNKRAVEEMKIVVNGEEFEWNAWTPNASGDVKFTFKDVLIEKSWTIQFVINIEDDNDNLSGGTIKFAPKTFNASAITPKGNKIGEYEDGWDLTIDEIVWSVSLADVKINPAKASLTNSASKTAEFLRQKTTTKTIFEGTYTAKKQDIYLNEFEIVNAKTGLALGDDVTFYLSIDGEEVASETIKYNASATSYSWGKVFSDILVEAGKSVKVKLDAEVAAYDSLSNELSSTWKLYLYGVDKDWTTAGNANANTVKMTIKDNGTISVTNDTTYKRNDVVLRANDINIATFLVKASNNSEGVDLESLEFEITWAALSSTPWDEHWIDPNQIKITVDWQDVDRQSANYDATSGLVIVVDNDLSEELPTEGLKVEISYQNELAADNYSTTITKVNETSVKRAYNKKVVNAVVRVSKQVKDGDETEYTFDVDTYEGETVTDLYFYKENAMDANHQVLHMDDVTDEATERVANSTSSVEYITNICYTVWTETKPTCIDKNTYGDYFNVGTSTDKVKVFKSSN